MVGTFRGIDMEMESEGSGRRRGQGGRKSCKLMRVVLTAAQGGGRAGQRRPTAPASPGHPDDSGSDRKAS